MKGLKPYICIHFTRTHWLSIAVFQTCPYHIWVGRMLQSTFPGKEGLDDPPGWSPGTLKIVDSSLSYHYFTSSFLCLLLQKTSWISFGVRFQFNKKNYLLGRFKKPAITMLFCNDPLQNRRNYFWKAPSKSKAEPSHFRNSNGLGLGLGGHSWEHADVGLPFSPSDASGLESKPSDTQVWGSISNFRLRLHCPHLLPFLIKQVCLFSEGKMRSRWQLIEKQQFAFHKGVL